MAEQNQIRTKRRSRRCTRFRVGKVSNYEHHGSWWVYYREGDRQVRRRVGSDSGMAEKLASDVNGQIAINAPTTFSFSPLSVSELRSRFLQHHEVLLQSSLATVSRYRAATQHLVDYAKSQAPNHKSHEISVTAFLLFLRQREVSAQ